MTDDAKPGSPPVGNGGRDPSPPEKWEEILTIEEGGAAE